MNADVRCLSAALSAIGMLLQPLTLAAAAFADVPDSYIHREAIEMLVSAQVLKGNPDGTFAPERPVNRAEFLTMLYRARGITPDPANTGCFRSDVVSGSWYENVVCDAVARRFVMGYPDGRFRPEAAVNRVEALKMLLEVFHIRPGQYGVAERDIIKFVDVSTSAWYSGYLYTAFSKGILPIPGQDGSRFYPEWPLLRGEAAAYIAQALRVDLAEQRASSSAERSARSFSSASTVSTSSATSATQVVTFPFRVDGKFSGKTPSAYTFSLVNNLVAAVTVSLQSGQAGGISCRLYELDASGFSTRYYLGYEEGRSCFMLVALSPGSYQLQVAPTVANTTFTAEMHAATGDGNDGFREAKRLIPGLPKTVTLGANNFADFYTFSVDTKRSLTVDFTTAGTMTCLIYPMENVDLESFAIPECNKSFPFAEGSYVVVVGRGTTKASKQTYTVNLR